MNRFLQLTPALATTNGSEREMDGLKACIELVRRSEGQTARNKGTTQKRTARMN